ncbi:MAG: tetratricopeptide repeat protein [Thermoguttaceae bacterium]
MTIRRHDCLELLLVTGILIAGQTGCLWKREAAVSPKTIVSRQLCRQAVAAMERAQWDDAEPLLSKAVEVCPESPDARSKYADLLWRRNQHAEAVREMAEAVRLSPDDALLHVAYGEMLLGVGNLALAAKEADLALDMQPQLAGAWALRGRLMRRSGKLREALSDLHRAEGLAPGNLSYQAEIADLYLGLHEPDLALATLQSLSSAGFVEEERVAVLTLKGRAYSAMGRYEDAADNYLLASSRGGADSQTLFLLAQAQLQAGHTHEAVAAARQSLALDPENAASRQLLAQLGIDGGPVRR